MIWFATGKKRKPICFSLDNIHFEKINDVWVPMEADMKQTEDCDIKVTKWHHTGKTVAADKNERYGAINAIVRSILDYDF